MKADKKKEGRIYICHTYYHVYISVVRELIEQREDNGKADIILSTMSNDFESLNERLNRSGLFEKVMLFDEKPDFSSPEVMKYKNDTGSFLRNMLQRFKYTKKLGILQEESIPTDLSLYKDVYVFCDSDPIGYYLNYKKIRYHALEDGLNCGRLDDQARNSNPGMFGLKKLIAKTGLIFIECGYSRYCKDYIVNDISQNLNPPSNVTEWRCSDNFKKLSREDHLKLIDVFLEKPKELLELFENGDTRPYVMILTEPLCELDVREKIFRDIVDEYKGSYNVIIKPHPRDLLDYAGKFPDAIVITQRFPMEIMNDIPDLVIDKVISVITQVDDVAFAKEKVYLGLDFLDKYEDASVHRKIGSHSDK